MIIYKMRRVSESSIRSKRRLVGYRRVRRQLSKLGIAHKIWDRDRRREGHVREAKARCSSMIVPPLAVLYFRTSWTSSFAVPVSPGSKSRGTAAANVRVSRARTSADCQSSVHPCGPRKKAMRSNGLPKRLFPESRRWQFLRACKLRKGRMRLLSF